MFPSRHPATDGEEKNKYLKVDAQQKKTNGGLHYPPTNVMVQDDERDCHIEGGEQKSLKENTHG